LLKPKVAFETFEKPKTKSVGKRCTKTYNIGVIVLKCYILLFLCIIYWKPCPFWLR